MTPVPLTRRQALSASIGAAAALASLNPASATAKPESPPSTTAAPSPFRYCLNTATIRGQKLSLVKEIEIAAKAGYDGIEPWSGKLSDYAKSGGSLEDLRKRLDDLGLSVESAIGFARWIVDDDATRAKGLEQIRREMDMLARIGGKRIAAPPAGATSGTDLDLRRAAERYRALLEIGDETGVTPQLELWGPSRNLHSLGECAFVAVEAGHPKACFLPDVYHIYKGGSDHTGLRLFSPSAIHMMHMNDYPADPPREKIGDRDRVYPGDGIAPMSEILRNLCANGGSTVLSLELFSPIYWEQDPLHVAKTGLEKMRACVAKALRN